MPTYGAGTSYLGAAPAGLDPVAALSASGIGTKVDGTQVALFDLATRSSPHDALGYVKRIHWVDQAVALALGITQGKLTSNKTLGNRLRMIPRGDLRQLQAAVEDAVRIALARLLEQRDIVVTSIVTTSPIRSQLIVVVNYVNLRLTPRTPSNISFVY